VAGDTGAAGAAALWNFTGAYSGGATYAVGDVATFGGATWYRINANGGNVGDTPAQGSFWTLLADQGDQGIQGIQGVQGDQGIQGIQGDQGIQGEAGEDIDSADKLPLAGGTMTGAILFGTGGQNIGVGSFDNSTGGSSGISLVCAVGYELNWQGGHISNTYSSTNYAILCDSSLTLAAGKRLTFGDATFLESKLPVVVDLGTTSGTIATDAAACDVVDVAVNGTAEIGNPTNSADGQTILWRIARATAEVVTLGSEFAIASGSITNATHYRTFVRATYSAGDSLWFADVTNVEVLPPVFTTGVALLLHMDGANASTSFTDSSSQGLIVGPNGDAQISTAQSVFGGASALFDGSGDYIEISSSSLDLGAGDFCVEGWIRFNSIADGVALVNKGGSGSNGWSLYYYSSTLYFGVPYVSNLVQGAWSAATGTWYHLACTRQGTDLRLFLDGALLDTQTNSDNLSSGTPCRIGQSHSGEYFDGYIDEVRIVKGAHVYGAAFSVPAAPLTDPV